MNFIIYLIILLISILTLYFFKKYFEKTGLIVAYTIMNIVSFILSFKYITLSTINLNSNCIPYITMFTSLYLLLEVNSKKETKKIIFTTFIINIMIALILFITTLHDESLLDSIGINMKNIFYNNFRILIAYPITTMISNYIGIWIYNKVKPLYENAFITMVTSILLVGIIDGLIYNFIAYYNILSVKLIIQILLSSYMLRLTTAVIYGILLTFTSEKQVIK